MRRLLSITGIGLVLIGAALGCAAPGGGASTTVPPTHAPQAATATTKPLNTVAAPTNTVAFTPIPTATTAALPATATAKPAAAPKRVTFPSGGTSATLTGNLSASGSDFYVLRILEGQHMILTLTMSSGEAALGVTGGAGAVMLAPEDGQTSADIEIPATTDYVIEVRWVSGDPASYSLVVEIPPPGGVPICVMITNADLTAYFDPTTSSDVFGQTGVGDQEIASYRTADGWIGFDPPVAHAGDEGMDRYRWVHPSAGQVTFDPAGCDATLPIAP